MKYNSKYDIYVDDDFVIYRYDKNKDKLVQCNQHITSKGYMQMRTKISQNYVHRIIWETFYGEIPNGYQIDHINTVRTDNRLENLRLVTCKENGNNPLTKKHYSESHKGKVRSEFGIKFKEHFGITRFENEKLYLREIFWYKRHNKTCRWEMNTDERD